MNYPTFEDFLQSKHAQYYRGTDDDMPDALDNWIGELDVQEVLDYAEEYGKELFETYIPKNIAVQHLPSDYPAEQADPVIAGVDFGAELDFIADQEAKHGEERVLAND